uniref:hypothetical protein n=1 Tax=Rahnella sp. RFA10(1/100) TaxID=2511202 RepID=UPI001021AE8A|nr:hypothetical protein [Rahnella sp. RFA10(1/100)]
MCKFEYALIAIAAVFTTVVLIFFIYTIYYNIGTKMELGSLSDWISSLSTFGTLVVALMAYRKAPEWMAQKHYNTVSKVIEEAVYEDLRKLSSLSLQYKSHIVHTCFTLKKSLNAKDDLPSNIKDTLDIVENLLIEFFNLSYSIQNRLKSISRYNYVITPYALNVAEEIKNTADNYNDLQTKFELSASEVTMLLCADEQAINLANKEISEIQIKSIELNMKLSNYIKSVYAENKSIDEFIMSKK